MKMESHPVEALASEESFIRYCLNESESDISYYEELCQQHPEKRAQIDAARELVMLFSLRLPETEYAEEKQKIINALEERDEVTLPSLSDKKRNVWSYIPKVAAILIFGVMIGISVPYFINFSPEQEDAIVSQTIIKQNPRGQKTTVFLNDGTKVILNAESSIEYKRKFENGLREVKLIGEAFFEVAHDESRPFVVKSGSLETTALGTSFNIKAHDEEDIKVSLLTGKVKVVNASSQDDEGDVILMPGEQVAFVGKSGTLDKGKFDLSKVAAWKDGFLIFEDNSMEEIKQMLERWYGVDIRLINENTKVRSHYSGEFDNQSLETVLKAIGFSKSFDFDIKDKIVTIEFQ